MGFTVPLEEIVQDRARREPEFRVELLKSAIECMLGGELDVAQVLLIDCIESTGGFEGLGERTGKPADNLKRMLHPDCDTSASDLFEIIKHLQRHEGIRLQVQARPIDEPQEAPTDAAPEPAGVADT